MKLKDCITCSFHDQWTRIKADIASQASQHLILHHGRNDVPLWQQHLSANSHFCRTVVANHYLTSEQMHHAALRYRLGMARDGGVIFWQIGPCEQVCDGKIMYYRDDCHRDHHHSPTWVSSELKRFYLGKDYPATFLPVFTHCLFGLHLLTSVFTTPTSSVFHLPSSFIPQPSDLRPQTSAIAIVESEKTAVIMSEIRPQYLWLATGGLEALRPEMLFPLRSYRVILFPDTDETGSTFAKWYDMALKAQKLYVFHYPIRVSPLLEQNATPDQKRRKIDLVDYLFEQ